MSFKQRELYPDLLAFLPDKRIIIITGARQTGKTSLLRALYAELTGRQEQVCYLSLEDPLVVKAVNEHPERVLDFLHPRPRRILDGAAASRAYLLIDEVQYAQDPSNLLKYLFDTYEGNLKVIATGSSAFYIDRKFRDSLAGRKRIFQLNTLNFREMLLFQEQDKLIQELDALRQSPGYQSVRLNELRSFFFQYLCFGGYPAVVLAPNDQEKRFTLDELKNAYVRRDVLESQIHQETKFFQLFQLLADQTGNLLNKNTLATEVQLDAKTVDHYIYVLEKSFHISLLKPFFKNLRKELSKMPKVYFNDLGMRNVLLYRLKEPLDRADKGQLLENYFFLRLRELYTQGELLYWRQTEGREIDFIIREDPNAGKAVEVKWSASHRTESAYSIFTENYPDFQFSVKSIEHFYE